MTMRALLALLTVTAALSVSAQTVERPQWKIGDTWSFEMTARYREGTSTWSREVVEASPDGTFKVKIPNGTLLTFDGEANSLDSRGPAYTWRRFSFPMTVGKRWSYDRKVEGQNFQGGEQATFAAVAYEKLTVPAGTFDCMKVEGAAYRNWDSALSVAKGWNNAITKTTYWYCPEVGFVGKWIVEEQAYKSAPWTKEESVLTSFTRAK